MGTMIQQFKLEENDFRNKDLENHPSELKGNNDLLSITRPDVIKSIHQQYLEAGSNIIETNTFNATTVSQRDYNTQDLAWDVNVQSAKLAREAISEHKQNPDKPVYLAGAMCPTNVTPA